MKILHVTNFFKPSWESGGPARVAYEISKTLVERGHEVTVYTTDGFKSRLDVEKNKPVDVDGIKTYYFRNLSTYLSREMVLPIPYYLQVVARNVLKDFDVIHIHEHRTFLAVVIHHYAKKHHIPYILQAHGSVLPFFHKQRLKNIFDLIWGNQILKDASKVIALTKTEAEQYKMMGVDGNKIEIVPNGIDISKYEKLPDRGVFNKKYGINSNEKIVLYLGRMHKSKGVDLLVEAFLDISKELNDIRLVLIGPNDGYRQSLVGRAQKLGVANKILFTGFVTDDDKIEAFVDADIFVTPSFSGFPVTFLEACACGTPIITTDNGDKLDWIHDKVGYVVKYDKEQLRDAVFKMLSDDELRLKFGEEGRRLATGEFAWGKIVKQIEWVYEDVKSETGHNQIKSIKI